MKIGGRALLRRPGLQQGIGTLLEALWDGIADIRNHPGRTALQTIGVLLGVASVVAVLTIVDTTRNQTLRFFEQFGGLRKVLIRQSPPRGVNLTARERAAEGLTLADAEALRQHGKAFDIVDPITSEDLPVRRGNSARTRWVVGVTPSYPIVYNLRVARGRFLNERDLAEAARVVILGDTMARRLFGGEDPLGQVVDVAGQGFQVIGILTRKEFRFSGGGGHGNALEWMNEMILIPLTAMTIRIHGDPKGHLSWMNVMALTPAHADQAALEVERILLRAHEGVRDFEVINRRESVAQFQQQFRAFNVTFIVSAAVSLLVGGVVITNILLASFRSRVREVGVRKAVGANALHIFAQFLVESVVITMTAGIVGLPLGAALSRGVGALTGSIAPVKISTMIVALAVAVTTGIVFGFYPALRAARLNPVEALRYE